MKKIFLLFCCFSLLCVFGTNLQEQVCADMKMNYMAIVIDDFGGYNRNGVEEILSLDCPITCAIMPGAENSFADAEMAHERGHEVILHMPMEAHTQMPEEWYGNVYIKNTDEPNVAREKVEKCFSLIPYAKGMNIHIGSGVSQNREIMTGIMEYINEKQLYFCDSKTSPNSVCEECATLCGADFVARDEFLEVEHQAEYSHARQMLMNGAKKAKQNGYSVVIGHVGAEGGISTYQAIKDSLVEIEKMGVKIVKLSKIIDVKYGRSK